LDGQDEQTNQTNECNIGTLSYTAPEVYFVEKFTPKADVFSLGLFELSILLLFVDLYFSHTQQNQESSFGSVLCDV